ncbi:MAG: hypothetical protein WCK86_18020, partial [Planctomycetia bacterium]
VNEAAPVDHTSSGSSNVAVEPHNSGSSGKNDEEATYGDNGTEPSGSPVNEAAPVDHTSSGSSNVAAEPDNSGSSGKNNDEAVYGDNGMEPSGDMGDVGDTEGYGGLGDGSVSGSSDDAAETYYGDDDDGKSKSGSGKGDYIGDLFSDYNGSYDVIYSPGTDFTNYPTYVDDPGEDDEYSDSYLSGTTYYGTKPAGGLDLYSELEELKGNGYKSGNYAMGYSTYATPVPEPSRHMATVLALLGLGIERIRRRLRNHSMVEMRPA